MPEHPDFDTLRREVNDAWLHLQRDDREPLRDFLVHLVDAIEAVSAPHVPRSVRAGLVLPNAGDTWRCKHGQLHGPEVGMCDCMWDGAPANPHRVGTDAYEAYEVQHGEP